MSDEQTPPKRHVNEVFTLDASGTTSDHDGPLAHLLSMSPVSDRDRRPAHDSTVRRPSGGGELPGISDVSGLEDLYVTTTELPVGEPPAAEPSPPASTPRAQPAPARADSTADSDPLRSFGVREELRFSTEARAGQGHSYPAPLVPHAVPAAVAPNRSVRVPGQERRRGALATALIEIDERRWFLSGVAGFFGLVLVVLLVVSDLVANPFADSRTDVVADNRVPAAPLVDEATETSEGDTSSSTGAGTGLFTPVDPTTSIESTTSSTAPASTRAVVTTARPAVRSTTTVASSSTTTSTSVSSTTTTATTATTAGSSSTTGTSNSTTTTTSSSTTTDTTDTTDGTTTTIGEETTTTTAASTTTSSEGSSNGSGGP